MSNVEQLPVKGTMTDDDILRLAARVLGNPLLFDDLKQDFTVHTEAGEWIKFARALEAQITPAAPAVDTKPAQSEGVRHFNYLCSLLPEGFHWSDPLTPDVMNHIVSGASAQSEGLRKDAETWRNLLAMLIREIPQRYRRQDDPNAPGHAHLRPGIWDNDNGPLSGTQCAWCAVWNEARAALSQHTGEKDE